MIAYYIPYAMAAVLIVAVIIDLRTAKTPNWLTLIPIVLFIAQIALSETPAAFGWQLGQGILVFVLGLVLFAAGGIGAGAVKLMAGTALLVPTHNALGSLGLFLAVVLLVFPLIMLLRKAVGSETSKWAILSRQILPMSLPIAVAGLYGMFVV